MSVHITKPVWLSDIQPPARKLVALRIADGANESGVCWPSMKSIARACGINERMARKHIAALEEDGWLKRVPVERQNGSAASNEYHWNIGKLDLVEEEDRSNRSHETSIIGRSPNNAPPPVLRNPTPRYYGTPPPGTTEPHPPVLQYRPSEPSVEPSVEPPENTCPQGGQVMDEPAEEIPDEPTIDPLEARIPSEPPPVPAPPSARPRNPVFDAVAEAWGVSGEQTKSSGSLIGKAATQIKATMPGRPVEEVAAEVLRRAANYRLKFPDCECTPSALIKHWPTLNAVSPRRGPARTSDALPGMIREPNLRPKMINLNPPTP